jgi:hypothetical protein
MTASLFPKTESVHRSVAKVTGAAGGSTSRIVLNKDSLIAEHALIVDVAQTFTGAPTAAEMGRFIKGITIETDKGSLIRASGATLYELARFTESGSKEVIALGTSSAARFMLDLHYELDGGRRDLSTALESSVLANVALVIEWAADADNGFIGGTGPGAASYSAEVVSRDFPDMQHVGAMELDESGELNPLYGVAQFVHFTEEQVREGASAGTQSPVRLMVGNSTRFIGLVVEDTSGGAYVGRRDDILQNIRLVIGGKERRKVSFNYLRHDNAAKRSFDQVGVAFMDWGDDEVGFLNLEDAAEALLEFDTALPAGVTAFRVRVVQDYVR